MIIAFTGKMGAGKSTAIEMLKENCADVRLVKFAQPLYDMQAFIQNRAGLPSSKDRKLLQWLGTEWGRGISESIWVDIWAADVRRLQNEAPGVLIVCDDCRYDNEAEKVKSLGGIVLEITGPEDLRRERIGATFTNIAHSSEQGLKREYVSGVVENSGTKDQFADALKYALDKYALN